MDSEHPFLLNKVVSEACYSTPYQLQNSMSLCPGGFDSTNDGSARPCANLCDHGTHVAGIAAGNGVNFSGVARDANIIAIQVYSQFNNVQVCGQPPDNPCVSPYTSDVVRGLGRVLELRDVFDIASANISMGSGNYPAHCDDHNPAMTAAINQLRAVNIPTIIASGNNGNSNGIAFPACISTAISVGSVGDGSADGDGNNLTIADQVSSSSQSAAILDLLAPGKWITSSVPNGGYATWSGTSMAAPHVAGAWAVLSQQHPQNNSVDEIFDLLNITGPRIIDARNNHEFTRIQVGCFPPILGDWIVTQNCTLGIDGTVHNGNLIVRDNTILTITNNASLGIDFTKYNLSVEDGSGVLIKNGGNIQATDVDGDSIDNRIDLEPKIYSDDFSNNQLHPTYGSIHTRGDQTINIFPDGNKIRLVASPNPIGGDDAIIEMCGNNDLEHLTAGADLLIECGSIDIQVNSGAVDVVLDSNNNSTSTVIAILDESDSFFFDEESFTMRSNAGTAEITIIAEDGTTEIPLTEGNAIIVDHETSIITADPDNISDVTIIIDGVEEIIPPGISVVQSPEQALENIIDDLNSIVSENAGSSLASKVVDASASVQTALDELNKNPSDNQAAAGNIEGAIGSLEDVIKDYGLDQTQGEQLIDQLLTVSRQLASNAISVATNTPGSDAGKISSANAALANGDSLRISPISFGDFKSAAAEYKTAIAEAEGALA